MSGGDDQTQKTDGAEDKRTKPAVLEKSQQKLNFLRSRDALNNPRKQGTKAVPQQQSGPTQQKNTTGHLKFVKPFPAQAVGAPVRPRVPPQKKLGGRGPLRLPPPSGTGGYKRPVNSLG